MQFKSTFFAALVLVLFFLACQSEKKASKVFTPKQYSIEQFYKNESLGGGSFSVDEQKLLYHSNQSGIFNLYEIDLATGESRPVTNSDTESYFAIGYANAAGDILYSADKGGNEIDHIYLLKTDGTAQDLTPSEGAKADFAGFNKDRTAFYYLSNKRDPQFFDFYKMNIGTWESVLLYQNNDGMDVNLISEDETTLALSKTITTSENQLFVYDRKSQSGKEISSAENKGLYSATGFSPDGNTLEYTTNVGKEFTYLVSQKLKTDEKKTIFEADWDVMYAYDSDNRKYKVIGVNEDGKNSITVLDNATGKKVDFPTFEDGDVLAVSIAPSETQMRISVGSSKSPNNLYHYDMTTKKLTKLTNSLNAEINGDDLVSAEVVRY